MTVEDSVGVVVLTLNAELEIRKCLVPLIRSRSVDRCIVVDSESRDGTIAIAAALGAEVVRISRVDFNHGATREFARKIIGTDIVVFVTQDALATSVEAVDRLVEPIRARRVGMAFGRQVPREGADLFESVPRLFSYPLQSYERRLSDVERFGVGTFFCSNSFAAYRQSVLDDIGGFRPTLTNEDYFAAGRILQAGGALAYVADSVVVHSHRYSLIDEFRRYFDTGYVRAENPWVQRLVGSAEARGMELGKILLGRVFTECPWMLPYAVLHLGAKWIGFRLGFAAQRWPIAIKRCISGQRYFWDSKHYRPPSRTCI